MAIATYINDLLYRYECVILPGFGAFITQRQSARILSATNEFYPPQKTVSFNRQLLKNDGLLANHIVEVEKISYEDAVAKLQNYVEELQTVLEKNKLVNLSNIGSFTLVEDKILFEPAASTNYLKEAFGLGSFASNPVLRETYKKQAEAIEDKAPVTFTPERRRKRPYLQYAAIGLFALGLSGFAGLNVYSEQVNEHNIAEQQKAASQLESQIQRATFEIENPLPAITLNIARQTGNYHIVAGAFRLEENAQKKVQELRQKGYKARYIGENRYGLHQVVYSSHEARLDALEALREVKNTSNEGAWLLVQELE